MLKWILVFALLLGVLLGFLIKSGITLRTGEESAVRPGSKVETYQEHAISQHIKMKEKIQDIQEKREQEVFW